jgi:hypothetical protein
MESSEKITEQQSGGAAPELKASTSVSKFAFPQELSLILCGFLTLVALIGYAITKDAGLERAMGWLIAGFLALSNGGNVVDRFKAGSSK